MKIVCSGCGGRLWLSDMQLSNGGCNVVCPMCSTTQYVDASMMDQQALLPRWYYAYNDETIGPLSMQDMEFCFQNQQINLDTYVWCDGMSDWMALKDVGEFDYLQVPVSGAPTEDESTRIAAGSMGPSYASFGGGEETAAIDLDELQKNNAGGFSPFDSNNSGGIMGMDGKAAVEEEPAFDMSAQQAPSTPANDLIGARSENSVLFSLSALQAVSAPSSSTSTAAPASSGGAGMIDVKALATGAPAPRRRSTTSSGNGDPVPLNTVLPLGTKNNDNKMLIIVGGLAAVALVGVVILLVFFLNQKSDEHIQDANINEKNLQAQADDLGIAKNAKPSAATGNGLAADNADKKADDADKKADSADKKADDADKKADSADNADNADKKADNADKKADDTDKKADSADNADNADKKADAKPTTRTATAKPATKVADAKPAAKPAEPKPAAKKAEPKPAADKAATGNALTRDEVQAVIRSSFAQVRTCSRTSAKKGKMNVSFTIKGNGRVNGARVTSPEFQGTPTATCVLKVVNGLKFRETGKDMPISYPFQIQ